MQHQSLTLYKLRPTSSLFRVLGLGSIHEEREDLGCWVNLTQHGQYGPNIFANYILWLSNLKKAKETEPNSALQWLFYHSECHVRSPLVWGKGQRSWPRIQSGDSSPCSAWQTTILGTPRPSSGLWCWCQRTAGWTTSESGPDRRWWLRSHSPTSVKWQANTRSISGLLLKLDPLVKKEIRPTATSIMTPMALTCLWKSKWKSSSCSHFAKQVDIWVFSCSTYSSRGVMKFHFKIYQQNILN